MTGREFKSWIDCDDHHWEGDDKPKRMELEDDENLCTAQALLLLEHLDPSLFAIQASATGIAIYPRHHIFKLTTWEQTLLRSEFQIPADVIGGLVHIDQLTKKPSKTLSTTSETQQSSWRDKAALGRAQVVASSLTRFNQRMREFSSDGQISETRSTPDVSQLTSKARSGRRRWQRSERPSS